MACHLRTNTIYPGSKGEALCLQQLRSAELLYFTRFQIGLIIPYYSSIVWYTAHRRRNLQYSDCKTASKYVFSEQLETPVTGATQKSTKPLTYHCMPSTRKPLGSIRRIGVVSVSYGYTWLSFRYCIKTLLGRWLPSPTSRSSYLQ